MGADGSRLAEAVLVATDGYHIHTILNSKALPKLEDQMTLAAAAAAAVPLTLTHSTVEHQCFPSKHAVYQWLLFVYQALATFELNVNTH